jgi:4-amino-4-deoxy-L-arabinose transferase-like glycosyltransferase
MATPPETVRARRASEVPLTPRRPIQWRTVALILIFMLYFYQLDGAGLIGPDEPRYASIGRQMALSGDWVTPRLWGEPWFEKPALLYWMTAIGFRAGLGGDLAPRLPNALLSVFFLIFFFWWMRREFGERAAVTSAAILATSAGWLAFSFVAVPDIPVSVFFSAAMLLGMTWLRTNGRAWLIAAAASLGLAVLAKGLVPLALAIPFAWVGRRKLLQMLNPWAILAFLVVAIPWYAACYARNGSVFLQKFFLEHHVGRFFTPALQHGQPVWFFLPIFAAMLFPWTPALALLFRRGDYSDERRRLLLLWLTFGLVVLSLSANKLPGYVLPLLPAAAVLMGLALAEGRGRWALAASAALLCLVGPVASILPQILVSSLWKAQVAPFTFTWLAPLALVPLVWYLPRAAPILVMAVGVTCGVVYIKAYTLPSIDRTASARPLLSQVMQYQGQACVDEIPRNIRYGLNYYTFTPLPDCAVTPRPVRLRVWGH